MQKFFKILFIGLLYHTHFTSEINFGAHYLKFSNQTQFQVYATNAEKIDLVLFDSKNSKKSTSYPFKKLKKPDSELSKNTWQLRLNGNLSGKFYKYRVIGNNSIDYKVLGTNSILVQKLGVEIFLFHKAFGYMIDTSAKGYMSEYSHVVSKTIDKNYSIFTLNSVKESFSDYAFEVVHKNSYPTRLNAYLSSDPYCYDLDDKTNRCQIVEFGDEFIFKNNEKRIGFQKGHAIHEVHIKSLTKRLKGIPKGIQGTYKAISHPLTLKTLRDMGVSTIEFLPIHHFDYTAAPPNHINYWGYMTKSFFAIHPRYASSEINARLEFKEAIAALHRVGISVVLDVVYNHTSEGDHRGPNLSYKNLAREKYFRMHNQEKGYFLNTTGVGNTFASENEVSRKLILDSLKFFVETYQIDGFRFDLGAAIDKKTFEKIREALPKNTLLTAEPWVAEGAPQWYRGELNYLNVGAWNDKYRQVLKGGNGKLGFINGQENEFEMKVLIRGEHQNFGGSGSHTDSSHGYTNPYSTISEVEVHDGNTLSDWLDKYKLDDKTKYLRMKMAHTILLTSINTPILQLGQEFSRSKGGNHNSYDQDSDVNYLQWSTREHHKELLDFTIGLKKIRLRYDAFHFNERIIDDRIVFLDDDQNSNRSFGYKLKGSSSDFIILLNSDGYHGSDFKLPSGTWKVLSNGDKIAEHGLGVVTNNHYFLRAGYTAILKQEH
ncbi:MAG: hypothetical protein COB02_09220 [Candidatus Cloacimonadota bacterium]|nr:MAG: hypothetical protein COB02_09220 [Candidatus Cloacimonadota bacterium]